MTENQDKKKEPEFKGLRVKPKIAPEVAEKTLLKMMELNSVSEMPQFRVKILTNMIGQGKLYLNGDVLGYKIKKPIKGIDAQKLQDFQLNAPDMGALDDAGIKIWDFARQLAMNEMEDEKVEAFCALCMGLNVALWPQINVEDAPSIFIACSAFFIGQ